MRKFEKDYYAILGVAKSASAKEITSAYRKLALEYHPDVNPSDEAKERMPLINEAYSVLGDAKLRREFDAALVPTATRATLVIHRTGAAVGITRKMDVLLNGSVVGRVLAGETGQFLIEPGEYKLRVRLDQTTSRVVRVSCEAGTVVGFACGARSVVEYFVQSVAAPEKALFIKRML